MCGLIATFSRGGVVDAVRFREGLARLSHRGPDASCIEMGVIPGCQSIEYGLGHARLSILDLEARANQPFRAGGRTIIYNGEIYNFRALAQRLLPGFVPRTTGDTEVLLAVAAAHGLAALTAANGMWAFAMLDRAARRVIFGRDAYGKKPLFYVHTADGFSAASGLGALLALTGRRPSPGREHLIRFLADGWLFPDPSGSTHLADIREVRPGHCLTLCLDTWTVTEERVWSLPSGRRTADAGAAHEDLGDILRQAVEERLVSDRPVGLLLSGGVDSSLILSILAATGRLEGVGCYTGEAGKSEDSRYARACLERVGAKAREVPLDYGAVGLRQFLDVCRHQEKPFPLIGNVLGLPALYAAMAEDGVRVALDGTGADELFGGYWARYGGLALRDGHRAGASAWVERLADAGFVKQGPVPPVREALAESELPFLRPDARRSVSLSAPGDPLVGFDGSLAEAMRLDAEQGRMQEWLWQNDRSAMAHSVENRSPFLDERLAAFIEAPPERKFEGPWNKTALRALFRRFVDLPTATRQDKQGFRWVYGRFFRSNQAAVLDLLGSSHQVREFVGAEFIDQARTDEGLLDGPLAQRLLVLAGLEARSLL